MPTRGKKSRSNKPRNVPRTRVRVQRINFVWQGIIKDSAQALDLTCTKLGISTTTTFRLRRICVTAMAIHNTTALISIQAVTQSPAGSSGATPYRILSDRPSRLSLNVPYTPFTQLTANSVIGKVQVTGSSKTIYDFIVNGYVIILIRDLDVIKPVMYHLSSTDTQPSLPPSEEQHPDVECNASSDDPLSDGLSSLSIIDGPDN